MAYGYIEEGEEIVFKGELPKAWKDISGFNNATIEVCNSYGWYLVEEVAASPEDYETYTKSYSLEGDNVIRPYYTYNDMSLSDYKTKRIAYIKSAYDSALLQGCDTTLGYKIDSATQDTNNFSANYNYMVLKGLANTTIRDYDNVTHIVTLANYQTLCIELGDHLATLYGQKWSKQGSIDSATTLLEVEMVIW